MTNLHAPKQPDHGPLVRLGVGVVLINLGTPEAPNPKALRTYLAEFLADPRIVELPRWLWWLILHGVILRIRPRRAAKAYAKVWTDAGSPLMANSNQLTQAVGQKLETETPGIRVALAMRYGNPSINDVLNEMTQAGVGRLIVLPLYPQYSGTTTASVMDGCAGWLGRTRWIPDFQFITSYHDHPGYIEALAQSVRDYWQEHGQAERLLVSFHGIPQRYFDSGDPYHCHCHKTARLLAEALNLKDDQWQVAFQSRFGREPWLQPYTDKTLELWAESGVKSVQVICPGFAADCLETLEEIEMEGKAEFLEAGGQEFGYIPALNADPLHVDAVVDLIRARLS